MAASQYQENRIAGMPGGNYLPLFRSGVSGDRIFFLEINLRLSAEEPLRVLKQVLDFRGMDVVEQM